MSALIHGAARGRCGLYPEGSFWHHLQFRASYSAALAALTLGFSLRTAGTERIPQHGPVLLVANHQSFLDPMLVGLATRRELVYLARKTLFRNRFFAALIRAHNAVPIDQEGVGKEGLRTILDQLRMGRAVLIFPEGERTWTGKMLPLKPGIQLVIKRTRAQIIPVGIAGAYTAWPRFRPLPTPAPLFWPDVRGTLAVVIGEPEDTTQYAELSREQALTALAAKIAAVQAEAEKLRRKPY